MYWSLPGGIRFLDKIAGSLADNKHALLICPETIFRENLMSSLQKKIRDAIGAEITWMQVSPDINDDPVEAMISAFDMGERPGRFEDLLEWQDRPSRVIGLLGVDKGNEQRRKMFADLLVRAGDHAQLIDNPPFLLLAVATPRFIPPAENVRLACHQWWGILNQIDVDLVTEESLNDFQPSSRAGYYWAKSLSRGVARHDPFLARRLVEEMPLTRREVIEVLLKHANGQTKPDPDFRLHLLPARISVMSQPSPPNNRTDRELWENGWIDWCADHGLIILSTAIALAGNEREIERRMVVGQQEVILPLVEHVRQAIVFWLEKTLGEKWLQILAHGLNSEEEEAIFCEITPLAQRLDRYPQKSTLPSGNVSARLANKWKYIRNQLAHGRLLPYAELDAALSYYDEFLENNGI